MPEYVYIIRIGATAPDRPDARFEQRVIGETIGDAIDAMDVPHDLVGLWPDDMDPSEIDGFRCSVTRIGPAPRKVPRRRA